MKKLAALLVVLCPGLVLAQAPANDNCAGAIVLPAGGGTFAGTNVAATASLFGVGSCGLQGNDVWYKYIGTATGNKLVASLCPPGSSTFNCGVDILTGTSCFSLTSVACTTDWCVTGSITTGRAVATMTAGASYYIRVKDPGGATGTFTLYVADLPAGAQPNGTCGAAQAVFNGVNANKSNFGEPAALQAGFTPCATAGKDVFFSYMATGTGGTLVRTCLPAIGPVAALSIRDSVIAVYSNCAGGAPLACNDNGCAGVAGTGANLSSTTFSSVAGTTYIIQVAGAGSGTAAAEGLFDLEIIPPPPGDECIGAIPLVTGANGPFGNTNATTSSGYSGSCSVGYNDIFYSYVPTCASITTIDTGCAGFDTVLSVWSGCGGTQLACNDNATGACSPSSSLQVSMNAGTTYIIRVASALSGTYGNYSINITPGFGLNWGSPGGPGSLQFQICNGLPNGYYYLFASLTVATPTGSGWFYGLNMTLADIMTQINFGFPFSAPLNGAGSFTSPVFGLPSGLMFDSVAFSVAAGATTPSGNSGPKTYVIP